MPTTPSTPQHIDSYSIISISGHRLTSSSGKWGLKGKTYCIETKVEDAMVRDVYQLEMYWDGLVDVEQKIEEAILVANDFSPNVMSAIKHVNSKKDKKGKKYKIIPKKISDYPLS